MIAENHVHDIRMSKWAGGYPIDLVYLDNHTSKIVVQDNVIAGGRAAERNGSKGNILRNNIQPCGRGQCRDQAGLSVRTGVIGNKRTGVMAYTSRHMSWKIVLGSTRMALKLGPCFSRVIFPVAITVLGVFELVAGLGQIRAGVGPPFYGPRLATAGTIRD